MTIAGRTVLVTGASRGIGQALAGEALGGGAARVYAGTRQPLAHPGSRVTALMLDVTSAAQIQAAADAVESLDVLINNAGVFPYDDLSDRAPLELSLEVNFFGTYAVTRAFLPLLARSKGAIVNNVSLMALAPLPVTPAYSISKAAAFSLTQALRALLAARGVRVHAALTGPTDTGMTRGLDIPKASPQSVARAIFDAVDGGKRISSPIPGQHPSPGAGATEWPRHSNAKTRPSSSHSPPRRRHGEGPKMAAGPGRWLPGLGYSRRRAASRPVSYRAGAAPAAAIPGARAAAAAAALTVTLGPAAMSWVVAVRQMTGMEMEAAARLGPLGSLSLLWLWMMAAITAQKLLPPTAAVDMPLAVAITVLGIWIRHRALGGSRARPAM